MNCILQCLAHTPAFSSDFLDIEPRQRSGDTADAFADVLENLRGNDGAFSPSLFKSTMSRVAPYFRGRGQHDAHEFLRGLLEARRQQELEGGGGVQQRRGGGAGCARGVARAAEP